MSRQAAGRAGELDRSIVLMQCADLLRVCLLLIFLGLDEMVCAERGFGTLVLNGSMEL